MTTRTRSAVLGLVLATGLTATVTSASAVGLPAPYSQNDDAGDVTITKKKGLPDRQRRSIDLGQVQVLQDDANRQVEVLVTLRRITDAERVDQVVTVSFGSDTVGGAVEFSPSPGERRSGTAGWFDGGELEQCRRLVAERLDGGMVRTTVPYRCVPDVPVSVSTLATTEPDRRGQPWSADMLRSDGSYQLRPATQ